MVSVISIFLIFFTTAVSEIFIYLKLKIKNKIKFIVSIKFILPDEANPDKNIKRSECSKRKQGNFDITSNFS
jgi:hypothetical protein